MNSGASANGLRDVGKTVLLISPCPRPGADAAPDDDVADVGFRHDVDAEVPGVDRG